jgi:hypothetical protein
LLGELELAEEFFLLVVRTESADNERLKIGAYPPMRDENRAKLDISGGL